MDNNPEVEDIDQNDSAEDDVKTIMVEHDVDQDTAERTQELVDEGLDEDDAIELAEDGL